jgi:hypothetical protein
MPSTGTGGRKRLTLLEQERIGKIIEISRVAIH